MINIQYMIRPLFYKEWIKTRWFLLLAFIVLVGVSSYAMMVFQHAVSRKGMEHLLIMMLMRKATLVQLVKYLPIGVGLGIAIVQFVPEMHKKCLKLTLHLPFAISKSIGTMLAWGTLMLVLCFTSSFLIIFGTLYGPLPSELLAQSLSTLYPWYAAGFFAYFMVSATVLEPTWGWRIGYALITVLGLRIYLLSDQPFAYTHFTWEMITLIVLASTLSWQSVHRFKVGHQD